jgi:predicted nicotinamide N-methyase
MSRPCFAGSTELNDCNHFSDESRHDMLQRSADEITGFVRQHTTVITAPIVPEVVLHLATDARGIFQLASEFCDEGIGSRPFWAFAWPGGQGLSRYILDHPELVVGKSVLDVGSGSAMAAIAAMKAGAKSALAADTDPLADKAAVLNGLANNVALSSTTDDLLGLDPDVDFIIIGDLVYEPDLQIRVGSFIERAHKRGIPMLYGDRTSARRPRQDFQLLQEYEAPLVPSLVENFIERSRVWQL